MKVFLFLLLISPSTILCQTIKEIGFITANPPLRIDSIIISESVSSNEYIISKKYKINNGKLFRIAYSVFSGIYQTDSSKLQVDTIIEENADAATQIPLMLQKNAVKEYIDTRILFLRSIDTALINDFFKNINNISMSTPSSILSNIGYDSLFFAENATSIVENSLFSKRKNNFKKKYKEYLLDYSLVEESSRMVLGYRNILCGFFFTVEVKLYSSTKTCCFKNFGDHSFLLPWLIDDKFENFNPKISLCIAEILSTNSLLYNELSGKDYLNDLLRSIDFLRRN